MVIGTDYDSYASVHSCFELGDDLAAFEYGWVLTREKNPDPSTVNKYSIVCQLILEN